MYLVGQRVKARRDLYETSDEMPHFLYARAGEELVVRKINEGFAFPIAVSHENVINKSFGVTIDEIEVISTDRIIEIESINDSDIDTSEIAELDDDFFERAARSGPGENILDVVDREFRNKS